LGRGREEEREAGVGEEGARGETELSEVGGVEPELARGDRGDLGDVHKVDFEEEGAGAGERDDAEIRNEVALDELDLESEELM
jgi:hypothetical protein